MPTRSSAGIVGVARGRRGSLSGATLDRRGSNLLHGTLPARGYVAFSTDFRGPLTASIIDCAGRTVRSETFACQPGPTYVFSYGNLRAGIYWVRMRTPNGVFSAMVGKIG